MIDPFLLNPFATAYTHPANCQLVLPGSAGIAGVRKYLKLLTVRFVEFGYLGQIVGPHGCGKSTLAIAMSHGLQDRFDRALTVIIRNPTESGNRIVNWNWNNPPNVHSEPIYERMGSNVKPNRSLIVLDGCESLSKLHQRLLVHSLKRSSRCNRAFLLTTHRAINGVSVIESLQPQFQQFLNIVDSLQKNCAVSISIDEIIEIWSGCDKNYRIGLRSLYDLYSKRNSQPTRADRPSQQHAR